MHRAPLAPLTQQFDATIGNRQLWLSVKLKLLQNLTEKHQKTSKKHHKTSQNILHVLIVSHLSPSYPTWPCLGSANLTIHHRLFGWSTTRPPTPSVLKWCREAKRMVNTTQPSYPAMQAMSFICCCDICRHDVSMFLSQNRLERRYCKRHMVVVSMQQS